MSKLAIACRLSFEEWNATIPAPEDLPDPQYSKKHIRRMNALFNKMRGNKYHHLTTKSITIILVAAILVALLMSAFVFPSSRKTIIDNTFFNYKSKFNFTRDNNNSLVGDIEVGYLPDGFELEYQSNESKHLHSLYSNGKTNILIYKYSSAAEVYFDTENKETKKIKTNDITYTYYINKSANICTIIWHEHDYIYKIEGNISLEELFEICKTVK